MTKLETISNTHWHLGSARTHA